MPKETPVFDYEPIVNPRRARAEFADDWPARAGGARAREERTDDGAQPLRGEAEPSPPSPSALLRREQWSLKRGHALSFAGLFAFTFILYFRPHELSPATAAAPVALIAAVVALIAFIPSQLMSEGTLTARPREVNLLLLFGVTALLSVPLAVSPSQALHTFWEPFLKNVVIFILIINVVRTEGRLKAMLYLALTVTFVLSVMALNDYRLGNLTVEGYRIEGRNSSSLFNNTNDLGIHLVTMLPIAVALGLSARGILGRLLFKVCALLILATIVVTFSRGAFLGLVASGLFMAWKYGRRNRAVVFGTVFFVAILFLALAPGYYWTRIASIFDSSLDPVGSATARSGLLAHSFIVSLANPLFGVGLGNYMLISARSQVTHNAFTQVAAEMGLAAAVLYAMFIVAPLRRLHMIERETVAARHPSRFYYLSVGLQASLVGYMVSSSFASVAFYLYIYYLAGYAVCLRRIYLSEEATRNSQAEEERPRRPPPEETATSLLAERSRAPAP